MLATVIWIGGLATVSLLILPVTRQMQDPTEQALLLQKIQRRLDPLGWFSLILLVGTGLVQMNANPNYEGLVTITTPWALAIFFKHVIFLGMIGLSAYITWGSMPTFHRVVLRQSRGQAVPNLDRLQQRSITLIRLNLLLGLIVLAFTALARASG